MKGQERGGRGLQIQGNYNVEHFRSKDGEIAKTNEIADIELATFYDIDGATDRIGSKDYEPVFKWHAHPDFVAYSFDGKTWYNKSTFEKKYQEFQNELGRNSIGNMNSISLQTIKTITRVTAEGVSEVDLKNAKESGVELNYILTPKFDKVYFYTNSTLDDDKTSEGVFPLDKYYDVQAKEKPNEKDSK